MTKIKKIMIGVGVFLLLLLITWGVCETAGSDYYNYKGHVVDIAKENGDTVITTLCGNTESRFVLKWYSREKYKKDTKDIQIGDYIMLSTTQYSNTNIKKMSVDYGYSTDGKLVWINEFTDRAYILATEPTTNLLYFFDFNIENDISNFDGLKTGDMVRVYHHYPIQTTTITTIGNGVKLISDNSNEGLTEEEIKFIEEKGYTVKFD